MEAFVASLCLVMLGLYILRKPSLSFRTLLEIIQGRSKTSGGYFSLERATSSYDNYLSMSLKELADMRYSYGKLGRGHKRIGYELGYPAKLDKLGELDEANVKITRAIANFARGEFPQLRNAATSSAGGDVGRVRETLKHFVRDWSREGQEERDNIFGPILNVLNQVPPDERADMKVLIPGSGLGRLAWEVSKLGFETTANELSFFMTLAFRFLASSSATQTPNQHTIYPYINWFSHQRNNDNLFRGVAFPDELPRIANGLNLIEGDFLELRAPGREPRINEPLQKTHIVSTGYDFIVTLFFIDTSLNVISTLEHVHSLLRPGGTWINLGPLLWTSGAQAQLELSLEEVWDLARAIGFRIHGQNNDIEIPDCYRRRTVECQYTADKRALMKWLYQAEFWVATKNE